jgi:hypothetical protein
MRFELATADGGLVRLERGKERKDEVQSVTVMGKDEGDESESV